MLDSTDERNGKVQDMTLAGKDGYRTVSAKVKGATAAIVIAMAALAGAVPVKVACIGDSITYGLGLGAQRDVQAYPAQLQKILDGATSGGEGYEVRNFGNSGRGIYLDSMRGREKRGYRYMPEHRAALDWKPDIVICNLGINDNDEYIKEYTGARRRGQFVDDYVAMLSDYTADGAKPKFMIWTKLAPLEAGQRCYRSPAPFLMQADLEEVARRMDATPIDMQEPLREDMERVLAKDFLHPSAEGAKIIAEATAKAMLGEREGAVEIPADIKGGCEVWLVAGQSNIQKGWGEFNATPAERARVESELARLDKVDVRFWDFNSGEWTKLTRANALGKSALGVSFAIRRAEATGKSIALLYVAAGGAPTEAFLSETTMCAVDKNGKPRYPRLHAIATNRHRLDRNADFPCAWVAREYPLRRGDREEARWWPVSAMYDGGIKRLKGVELTGVLWYQGESNATRNVSPDEALPSPYLEETISAAMEEFSKLHYAKDGKGRAKPRIIVMGLPAMNRAWEPYRAAQKKVCALTGAEFVDTFAAGLGDLNDVHPRDKIPFADLAAAAARRVTTDED